MKTDQWVGVLSRRNGYPILPLRGLLTPETFSPVKLLRHRVMRMHGYVRCPCQGWQDWRNQKRRQGTGSLFVRATCRAIRKGSRPGVGQR